MSEWGQRIERYQDLVIWQRSMDLVVDVYKLITYLEREEKFGIVSQLRRAAVSVPCNIAEGWGRGKGASQSNFVRIARGSIYECETLLECIRRLGLTSDSMIVTLAQNLSVLAKQLNAYLSWLQKSYVQESGHDYTTGCGEDIEQSA